VGVVVGKLNAIAIAAVTGDIPQNIGFAIKGEVAQMFLRTYGIEPQFSPLSRRELSVPSAVEAARLYTFPIECDPRRPTAQQRAEAARVAAEAREAQRRRAVQVENERRRAAAALEQQRLKEREEARKAAAALEQQRQAAVLKEREVAEQRERAAAYGSKVLPVVLREVRPQYTPDAMRAHIEGTVLLSCVVKVDGAVSDVQVMNSLDKKFGLDEEAIKAASQWQFRPGTIRGEPVQMAITIEMTFKLK
jgi:TonB family protein